jgi:GDP-4-dehydro-6-deoxy-D-mannose reductase
VRDIVTGYHLLAQKGVPGEVYQLCAGKAVSIKIVLNRLLKMSRKKISIAVDKKRLRKADIPVLRGDNSKMVKELGWNCRFKLDETLKATLNFWRDAVSR